MVPDRCALGQLLQLACVADNSAIARFASGTVLLHPNVLGPERLSEELPKQNDLFNVAVYAAVRQTAKALAKALPQIPRVDDPTGDHLERILLFRDIDGTQPWLPEGFGVQNSRVDDVLKVVRNQFDAGKNNAGV